MTPSTASPHHSFTFRGAMSALIVTGLLAVWNGGPASAQNPSPQAKGNLRVMTYNVFEGADLTPALSAKTREEYLAAIGTILANVQATNPPARAAAIARQIGEAQPTLVGLQEVSQWKTCPATADLTGCSTPPTELYDILNLVKDALRTQGYCYKEVTRVVTNELRAPTITSSGPMIVLYQQRSAILARADIDPNELQLSHIRSAQFEAALTVPAVVGPITIRRAWAYIDAKFHATNFRFIDTQLEAFDPNVNYDQAKEMLSGPADTSLPVIIAMDSNSKANPPENPFTRTYHEFLKDGFRDTWTETQGDAPGLTCCQSPALTNPVSTVSKRIDLILFHGDLEARSVEIFGGQTADRAEGLWPSDHLGVAARLETE
jgi:endonuclease/exonuclease/phosphatase family metal-dependent hydrolase